MRYILRRACIANRQPRWIPLNSSRKKAKISGEVQIKFGLADPSQPNASKEELKEAWDTLIGSSEQPSSSGIQSLIDAPGIELVGIGITRANTDDSDTAAQSTEELDEEISSSELEEAEPEKKTKRKRLGALRRKIKQPFEFVAQGPQDVLGVVFMEVQAARDLPPERNGTWT